MNIATQAFDALMEHHRPPAGGVRARRRLVAVGPQGKRYLDFVQGWAVNCLGHSPPALPRRLPAGESAADA